MNEGQLKDLDEKLGDSIDADRWQASLKNLREEMQLSRQLNQLNGLENHVRVLRRAAGCEGNLDIWSYNIDQEFLPFQLVFMLKNKLVSEEIEVTDRQRAELKKITAEWHKQDEEIAEKQKGLEVSDPLRVELSLLSSQIANKAMDDQLNVYLPHQTQRLLQIRLQLMLAGAGYSPALAHPQWQDVLKLTTDQRRQFNAIIKDNGAELKRQGDTALEKRRDSIIKSQENLFEILESNQRERFEELFGDRVFLEWYAKAEE